MRYGEEGEARIFGGLGLLVVTAVVALTGCSDDAAEPVETGADALRVVGSSRALGYDYAARDQLITAAAGDERVVFVAETLAGRVVILDRFTGAELGEVPPPPDGWLLPFALRVPRPGRLVVLDPGGFPDPTQPVVTRVYDYDYRVHARRQRVDASLARTVRFDGLPLVFGEDIDVTSSGSYVVAESIVGAIWVIAPDGTISPGLFPGPGGPIAPLAPCTWPEATTVDGIPFGTAGNFAPGVVAVAERQGELFFSSTCSGGLFKIPMSSLTDPARSPDERANDIVAISPRAPGTAAETLHGLAFDRSRPDEPFIYATDSLKLRVIRIDVETRRREVVLSDSVLFNFPVKPQFLPPVLGVAPLLVPSDQEHRFSLINAKIPADIFQPPWLVTKVVVF